MSIALLWTLLLVSGPALDFPKEVHSDRVHITGCVGTHLVAPRVPLWSAHPGVRGPRPYLMTYLAGTRQRYLCDGAVVFILKREREGGQTFVQVRTVRDDFMGWVDDAFIGSPVPGWRCRTYFEDLELRRRCRAGK